MNTRAGATPSAREFSAQIVIPADHSCLAGHFPGQPIVPAVILLDEVLAALQAQAGLGTVTGITNAKFLAPVGPDDVISVSCIVQADGRKARFKCELGSPGTVRIAAQGELLFASP